MSKSKKTISPFDVRKSVILIAVVCFVAIAYLPSLQNELVNWDDDVHLYNNQTIKGLDGDHLKQIFTTRVNKIYIPLTSLSFAIEYHFVKDHPFLYHLNNLLLHIFCVILVYLLAKFWGLSEWGAGIAALLFGIHPLHVESVAWVTERKDVLYAFLYLAAMLCYSKYLSSSIKFKKTESPRNINYLIGCTVLGLLSMLAKPMALSLPLILWIMDWFYQRPIDRRALIEKVPLLVIVAAIGAYTYVTQARIPGDKLVETPLIWIWTFSFYLRQFIFPVFSVPLYRLPQPISLENIEYISAILVFVTVVGLIVRFYKHRWLMMALSFYFFSIFFLLRYDNMADTNIVADRWMYLPSLGFCVLLGYYADRLLLSEQWRGTVLKKILSAVLIFLAVGLGYKTFIQCKVWRSSVSLWNHQLRYYPTEPIANNNLATVLRDQELFQEAEKQYSKIVKLRMEGMDFKQWKQVRPVLYKIHYIEQLYKKAIAHKTDYVDAIYNLGNFYRDLGGIQPAMIYYKRALEIDPGNKDALINLGKLYLDLGQIVQAIEMFDQIIALDPKEEEHYFNVLTVYNDAKKRKNVHPKIKEAHARVFKDYSRLVGSKAQNVQSVFHLAYMYDQMGDIQKAMDTYKVALRLNPKATNVMHGLADLYGKIGEIPKAVELYQRIVEIDPRNDQVYLSLGASYAKLNRNHDAKIAFEKALSLKPNNADAYFNLGYIYSVTDQDFAAIDAYIKAVTHDPNHSEAYYNLGNVYASAGKQDKAVDAYKKTISINPNHKNAYVNLSILFFKNKEYQDALKYYDEAKLLGYDGAPQYERTLELYR